MSSMHDLFDLSGRTALITGGSRGLGFQIAQALGEFGAAVHISARNEAEIAAAVDRLRAAGIWAYGHVADAGQDGGDALLDAVADRAGGLDILVNNAGTTWGAPAEDHPRDGWDKVIDLNLSALFQLTQCAARRFFLPQGRGTIINVASIEGLQSHHPTMMGTAAYNASKGGVISLTRALAAEWGGRGIRVNALAPGYFPSKMTESTIAGAGEHLLANTPLGKLGGPDDLKGPALLLASDAGGHITGQVIVVDGGMTVI